MSVAVDDLLKLSCTNGLPGLSDRKLLEIVAAGELGDTATFAGAGSSWIDDTALHSGTWSAITALQDTTFTTLTDTGCTVNGVAPAPGNLNGKTLLKGITIYGSFTQIQIQASAPAGAVEAYNSP